MATSNTVYTAAVTGQVLIGAYNHLLTYQELLGLVLRGAAATANDMRAELGPWTK